MLLSVENDQISLKKEKKEKKKYSTLIKHNFNIYI